MKRSDYVERDYASLHIKKDTRQRLNIAKSYTQARCKRFMSQDEFINQLLDHFQKTTPEQTERARQLA